MDNLETIKSIFSDLQNAFSRLKEALAAEKTDLNRDATIQRFEFTFELAWKLMKALNFYYGQECYNPRECVRLAAQNSLIKNPENWFAYLKARNIASHVYDEQEAEIVYSSAKNFVADVLDLIKTIEIKLQDL